MSYSLEDFRTNKAHVEALNLFLSSDAGVALQAAMRNEAPSRKLGRNFAGLAATNQRATAVAETVHDGTAGNLLGKVEGFEAALALMFESATEVSKPREKVSKKGSGRGIAPEPAPES